MSRAFSTHFANLKLQATSGSHMTAEYHFSSLRTANGRNTPSATGAVFEISGNRVRSWPDSLAGFDPGRKVHEAYNIERIPKSFVYGREGKLVAQSFNMRTHHQFLQMLSEGGRK